MTLAAISAAGFAAISPLSQRGDREMERWVAEIKLRAIRRTGQLTQKLEKAHKAGKGKGVLQSPASGLCKTQVLKDAGITKQDAYRCEKIASLPDEEFERVIEEHAAANKAVTADAAIKVVKKRIKIENRTKARAATVTELEIGPDVRHGDFREALNDLPAGSVDLIFTDPPYGRDYLHLFESLGNFAARVLADGGNLLTYFGQSLLPEVLGFLKSSGLIYRWLICIRHEYGPARIKTPQVAVHQKPLLWFQNLPV